MIDTTLYDVIARHVCEKWKDDIERDVGTGDVSGTKISEQKLTDTLTAEQKDMFNEFKRNYADMIFFKNYFYDVRLLNYGIQLGMGLEKFIDIYSE